MYQRKKASFFLKLCLPFPFRPSAWDPFLAVFLKLTQESPRGVTLGGGGGCSAFSWGIFFVCLCVCVFARQQQILVRAVRCCFPTRIPSTGVLLSQPASPCFLIFLFNSLLWIEGNVSEYGQGVRNTPKSTKVSFNSAVPFFLSPLPFLILPACGI